MSLFYPLDHLIPHILGGYIFCSGRFSDSRIFLLTAPSHLVSSEQWHDAAFVPDHSAGPVPDSHGVPFYAQC